MATKQELIYDIRERLGIMSDDSSISNEYLSYLIDKYRALFLRNKYSDVRRKLNLSNYQKIKLTLEPISSGRYEGGIVRSIDDIPAIINFNSIDNKIILTNDQIESYPFNMVDFNRFKYVAQDDPFIRHLVYGTIADDGKLYMKSWDSNIVLMETAYLNGIFATPEKAWLISSVYDDELDFDLDFEYPLEAELLPDLINSIIKDLVVKYNIPVDNTNNANDDGETSA